jgi:signal transduction histidine kinase
MEPVDFERVVRRAAVDPLLGGAHVRIERQSSVPLELAGDAQLLERALRNLLHNSVAAQREVGVDEEIVVRLRAGERELVVEIDDHGPGISEEMQQRLFVPFATHKSDGAGLGLALSHRIVHLHGGELELRNRESGGARAVVRFELDQTDTDSNGGVSTRAGSSLRHGS